MSNLPHRFREDQFRRYEKLIANVAENTPPVIKCDPRLFGVSHITFVCRLRDAIKSYRENNWLSTINRKKFDTLNLQVSERIDGTVLLGTKDAIKGWMQLDNVPELLAAPSATIDLDKYLALNREFLMQCSHNRLLVPRIKLRGLTDAEAEHYQQTYDIALDKNPDGSYTLI